MSVHQVLVVTPDVVTRVFSHPDATAVRVGPDGVTLVGAAGDTWPQDGEARDGQQALVSWRVEDARGGEPTTAVAVVGRGGRPRCGVLGRFDDDEVAEAAGHGGLRHGRRTEPPRSTDRDAAPDYAWGGPTPYGFPFPVLTTAPPVRGGRVAAAVALVVVAFAAYPVLALLAGWDFDGLRSGAAAMGTFVVLTVVGLRVLVAAFRSADRARGRRATITTTRNEES